jgi:hypothetical protein
VAAEAGVDQVLVLHYFGTREGLFRVALEMPIDPETLVAGIVARGREEAPRRLVEALSAVKPDLIMLRVSGFGQSGPYSGRGGFGKIAEAFSGATHLTGAADEPPVHPGYSLGDLRERQITLTYDPASGTLDAGTARTITLTTS